MNRDRYRLVFNELIGAWVPVAENVSARGKRSAGRVRRAALAAALSLAFAPQAFAAGALPVAAQNFVDARLPGSATVSQTANNMVIHQTGNAVMLNWQSFNIGRGNSVHFDQSSAAMRAINVVAPGGPRSEIDGSLTAKGQVFIFNQAGILFGANAQVDVGGLVGSTLKLNDELLARALNSLGAQSPAFALWDDANRAGLPTGDIAVAPGARIVAAKNGRVLLAAPNVTNGGRIEAEEGQVVLAAGEKVYIADPLDSRLRGFLVEVDNGGKVTTEAASELLSDRGNVTLVGLNIRHAGAARATTSVTLNGTVYLKARDNVAALDSDAMFPDAARLADGESVPVGQRTGRIELAAGSVIDVSPDKATRDATVRDDALFRPSEVNLYGRQIVLEGHEDVAEEDGRVDAELVDGHQRHVRAERGRTAELHERHLVAHGLVGGHVAAGLPHDPDGRPVHRLAAAGAQEALGRVHGGRRGGRSGHWGCPFSRGGSVKWNQPDTSTHRLSARVVSWRTRPLKRPRTASPGVTLQASMTKAPSEPGRPERYSSPLTVSSSSGGVPPKG